MLLLMLVLIRPPRDSREYDPRREEEFMRQNGGWVPRLIFACFGAVSDLIIRFQDMLASRER